MSAPLAIAAPSCVIPAHVAENAAFLAHKVQEVGLCFFEARSCLAYTQEDLPLSLRALPLRWHMHLPVDLPWGQGRKGGEKAARLALAVAAKAAYLRPRFGVLHPPTGLKDVERVHEVLRDFLRIWQGESSLPVLLENIEGADMQDFSPDLFESPGDNGKGDKHKGAKHKGGYGICLDVGHMLAFGQQGILQRPDLLRRVQLLHWSAPGKRDDHLPLTQFSPEQKKLVQELVPLLPQGCTHMIEVFHWQGIAESTPVLQSILRGEHGQKS